MCDNGELAIQSAVRAAAYGDQLAGRVGDFNVDNTDAAPCTQHPRSSDQVGTDRHAQVVDTQIDSRDDALQQHDKGKIAGDVNQRRDYAAMNLASTGQALELGFKWQAQDDFLLLGIRRDKLKPEKLVEPTRGQLFAECQLLSG